MCLWTVDLFHFTLKLFNIKGSMDGKKTGELVKKRQLHLDEQLRTALYEKTESRAQIEGFKIAPTSHMCRILSRIFERIIQEVITSETGKEKRFWLHELVHIVQEQLPRLEDDDVNRIAREIYQLATELKIIEAEKTVDERQGLAFNLKITSRSLRTLEKEIIARYAEEKCRERSPSLALDAYKQLLQNNPSSLDYHLFKDSNP